MKKSITYLCLCVCLFSTNLFSKAVELSYYLPEAKSYQQDIVPPHEILGYQVGEWHVRPEQIERYMLELAKLSPRVEVEITGYSHEKRPLMLVYISSADNIQKLQQIRQAHLKGDKSAPAVTWMGYSVHGNEPSGANTSLLFAYHLAAAQDSATKQMLNDQVIIIDPVLNPDGLARFAHWANMHKSKNPNADPNDIEHNEAWPNGRTNHYWFDLNRDWLLLQHPESVARVTQFHRWRPHVLTDFHEMGTHSTYFFQPGVPSRQNPLTPQANFDMTATIAEFHGKALDEIGSLYYSKESFDDFYYGKGSTYPDINGAVGILFEQASSRGHVQESKYGKLTFPFTIRNQLTTSFSTLAAVQANLNELKAMRAEFDSQSVEQAKDDKYRGVVVSSQDKTRLAELTRILSKHQIKSYQLSKDLKVGKRTYAAINSLIVPLRQPQYRLIKALFETRTQFKDKVFYDVSAWNLAMAFDLNYDFVRRGDYSQSLLTEKTTATNKTVSIDKKTKALAFDWNNFSAARLLSLMLQKELKVQVVTKPSQLPGLARPKSLSLGSLIVPLNSQSFTREEVIQWLLPKAEKLGLSPIQITSGLATSGVDMGSPSVPIIEAVKPLMLIGDGVSGYNAGEFWHLLDQRLSQPLTMVTIKQFAKMNIGQYTHLIMPDGNYKLKDKNLEKLESWIKQGGTVIAASRAAKWVTSQGWTSSEPKKFDKPVDTKASYQDRGAVNAEHFVGGAIVKADIDTSHPLGFGLDDSQIFVFKRGNIVFKEAKEPFVSIVRFAEQPLASGYMSDAIQQHLAEGTSLLVQRLGKGKIIAFSDSPAFRGYWLGTAKILTNALYFSKAIQAPVKTKEESKPKKHSKPVDKKK